MVFWLGHLVCNGYIMQLTKSSIGKKSLVAAVLGFACLELMWQLGWVQGPFWRILLAGFEAATIGAIADWFAVSALFYEIPIPLVRRHTNIIVKNRRKLTEGIVDMVTNKWLSPERIREKLADVRLGRRLVEELHEGEALPRLVNLLRKIMLDLIVQLDMAKLAIWLQWQLKNKAEGLEIEKPLGQWLADMVNGGRHHRLVEILLQEAQESIRKPEIREVVYRKLRTALDAYSRQDWVKGTTVWLGKKSGGIDLDLLADRLIDIALVLAKEVERDSTHPLRDKLDGALLEFAISLQEAGSPSQQYLKQLKRNLMLHDGMQDVIAKALTETKEGVEAQLSHIDTPWMRFILDKSRGYVEELLTDAASIQALDDWLKGTISNLLNTYHPEIGNIVRESLEKLDNKGLMEQIRDKVGNDLQYIRLNGAVVGGLVGLLIALIRWFVGG
ncbi:hypothetical protein ADIS_2910 [Lunatimonas lonarensis]|uniref:DUF445 domain-containing protein n=2 Tax=Lunatimonas lonarensis TaxID=1232681 RepID=R7ZQR9_9BACT|nr:hypothetical protein ADIS_2910 [Lunatimonas lonarensis]